MFQEITPEEAIFPPATSDNTDEEGTAVPCISVDLDSKLYFRGYSTIKRKLTH